MSLKTAKQVHEALDEIRDRANPGTAALAVSPDTPLFPVAILLATLSAVQLVQARTLALILERLEASDKEPA